MKSAQEKLDDMRGLVASMERHGAALQAELARLRAEPGTGDWVLRGQHINEFQQASIARAVKRCKQAHFTNLDIRINGKNEAEEADWVKWLEPVKNKQHDAEREARDSAGIGDERNGRIESGRDRLNAALASQSQMEKHGGGA